jgi:hypothetical protein
MAFEFAEDGIEDALFHQSAEILKQADERERLNQNMTD